MNAELERLCNILKVPAHGAYRVTICWKLLEGWYFIYEGTSSYEWPNLRHFYADGKHVDIDGFHAMLDMLEKQLA